MSTTEDIQIPADPNMKLSVLRRYLHIIALLQNRNDQTNWNGNSIADLLTDEEHAIFPSTNTKVIDQNSITRYVRDYLKKELGIDIDGGSGSRKICLNRNLDEELLLNILPIYSTLVADDSSKEIILKNLIKKQPNTCLWNMAIIHFSTIKGFLVEFDYVNAKGACKRIRLAPFHLVFRNNNLYLCGQREGCDGVYLFVFNRISNLKQTDYGFDTSLIKKSDEIFKGSLGSFIGDKFNVVIQYSEKLSAAIEEILSILEPKIIEFEPNEKGFCFEASFSVSDDLYLCKQLFMYGREVEIIKPVELRTLMIKMLKESSSLYE
ncbi:MAG: WYL domain-containing protein [Spirochaetes bacterium]|nr:WYL domain-containing protein [Spirochaetota bacterium]MBN2769696.1 WYL domain-containing protein [Spirochaetota bacterium]